MTEEVLAKMRERPGLYVFADDNFPGHTNPVLVIKDAERPHDPGRMFMLEPTFEVTASAEAWRPTSYLVSGPHSVQAAGIQELREESMRDEIDFWKNLVLRGERAVSFMRDFRAATGDTDGAADMDDILGRTKVALRAIAQAEEMHAKQKQVMIV